MGTAKQLIPAFVDAEPLEFGDRSYSKNMRPIRGYPDYWRIIDTESFIDGPPSEGTVYNKDLFLWRAQILKDEGGNLTDTFEAVNLGDFLTGTSEEVNGETVYRYKYNSGIETFQYQHTDVIDSVSIEFDQLGRKTFAFESAGDVFLIFFDSQLGAETTANFGAGHNPQIVTDSYKRTGGSADSERFLFYVDNTTKQIVYRRQEDRFSIVYTLPNAPADVVELLKVSKNIYGGLTVLYCYDNAGNGIGEGSLVTGSFTARSSIDTANIGTDKSNTSSSNLTFGSGLISDFQLKVSVLGTSIEESGSFTGTQGSVSSFLLKDSRVIFDPNAASGDGADNSNLTFSTGAISTFTLAFVEPPSPEVFLVAEELTGSFTGSSGTISSFLLKETLINSSQETETSNITFSTGAVSTFTLG